MSRQGWDLALQEHARRKNPEKELPSNVLLKAEPNVMTIWDGYEKAKFHFLVLPRDPFTLASGETLPSAALSDLRSLRKSPHALEVLRALEKQGNEVKDMIEDEMLKREGWVWPIHLGFHAVESMKHVHLHVISSDLISDRLKNKKHYNSFHPTLGIFLHLSDVFEQVESGTTAVVRPSPSALDSWLGTKPTPSQPPDSHYAALEKEPLVSFYTDEEYKTIPKLKEHLEAEWKKRGTAAKKKAKQKREAQEALTKGGEVKKPKEN